MSHPTSTSQAAPFVKRHNGPDEQETTEMLSSLGLASLDELTKKTVPNGILLTETMSLATAKEEHEVLADLKLLANQNKVNKSYIGMGYANTHLPAVIKRNVLENPGWYTAYTPYQAEIAQGRLEALLNYQQMIMDLTGMEIANASLLDEGTAAAEAMTLCKRSSKSKSDGFFVANDVHPQTLDVLKTRASYLGFELIVGNPEKDLESQDVFGVLLQYPSTTGELRNPKAIIEKAHKKKALVCVATDLLALVKLTPPGEFDADVVIGNSQRFGVPMGFGGPHAAFFASRDQFKRSTPGRIIGVSQDSRGKTALRMAMQTREQHIRREKATSNICTAQALLANIAGFYATYHGPEGLKAIANKVHDLTNMLAAGLEEAGYQLKHDSWFDSITVLIKDVTTINEKALAKGINFRLHNDAIGISLDETTTLKDLDTILEIFGAKHSSKQKQGIPQELERHSSFLTHPVFNRYHSETNMLRYLKLLENKDFSLTHGMIPLGSCTMKLNASTEMEAVSWSEFANIHPFAPHDQTIGYRKMIDELAEMLCEITGFDAMSMQPNSGAQGEYAGLLAIRRYQQSKGQGHRNICLIPSSAHGTNPASATMMGLDVVVVQTDSDGNIDLTDLQSKIDQHRDNLSALMLTYPSTHGVFEEGVRSVCEMIHEAGGQVYMDGANLNAQVGLTNPATIGADVTHLNLHKTFCIPHGGGGPGMGPIGVKSHLAPYLPNHAVAPFEGPLKDQTAVSAAPYGSALILTISWVYIRLMGAQGLKEATQLAILNANYIAKQLENHYPVLYKGRNNLVAHECIIDIRDIKEKSGVTEQDIAKRLMDYGFHAPTMSWPVIGTMMIEPTESESKLELDRFIQAMISIRQEITAVEEGRYSLEDNPVVNAPHTQDDLVDAEWTHAYSREQAVFPNPNQRFNKFWPTVNRIDNAFGDRNFVCSCPPLSVYENPEENTGLLS